MTSTKAPPKIADVCVIYTEFEWQMVKQLTRQLDARGYTVSPSRVLELPGRPPLDVAPADAKAVLVVWPARRELFDKPALEARAASKRKHLVQIYAGHERPDDSYDGPAGIDFSGWSLKAEGPKWAALMRQLKDLCGPPPNPVVDVNAAMPGVVLASTVLIAIIAGCASLLQQLNPDTQVAQEGPHTGATQAAPSTAPTSDDAARVRPGGQTAAGGPVRYTPEPIEPDRDLGVAMPVAPLAPPPPPPAAPQRMPQGPEQ